MSDVGESHSNDDRSRVELIVDRLNGNIDACGVRWIDALMTRLERWFVGRGKFYSPGGGDIPHGLGYDDDGGGFFGDGELGGDGGGGGE